MAKHRTKTWIAPPKVEADPAERVGHPPGSYCVPPRQYVNQKFHCGACGRPDVWTAAQQKFWYEVVKAHVFARPTLRCAACRKTGNRFSRQPRAEDKRRVWGE